MDLNRPCGARVSKKAPDAYTKVELVELAVQSGYKKTQASRMTKEELCKVLKKTVKKSVRRSPRKSPKKSPKKSARKSVKKSSKKSVKKSVRKSSSKRVIKKSVRKPSRRLSRKIVSRRGGERVEVIEIIQEENDCVSRSKIPLKEHQRKLIEVLNKRRGLIAIHSTGSGKTLTAVTASQCFLDENPSHKVIVITPVSLQGNFKKEMKGYGANVDDPRYFFYTIAGFNKAVEKGSVERCNQCMLIVDEAHNIRTMGGAQASTIIEYSKRAKKVLLLTATPVVNYSHDLSNLISIVNGTNPLSKKGFEDMMQDPDEFYNYFVCKISMFSPDDAEIVQYYPKSINHDVFIPMTKSYEEKYQKIEENEKNDLIVKLFGEKNLEKFYNGVRRASNNLDDSSSPKIVWIMNKINESEKKDKFVIFSHFLEAGLRLLMKELDKKKISYKYIDGTMSKKKREEIVEEYNNNKIKVLLISKAGGEGLDLKATRNIIIMEPSWNEATHKQVIGRAIRYKSHEGVPKKDRVVDVYRLFLLKRAEEAVIDQLMDPEVLEEGSFQEIIGTDGALSVDFYLRNFVVYKQRKIDEFLQSLSSLSIENNDC
jgi:SNF2 family DNA or RNA helicase